MAVDLIIEDDRWNAVPLARIMAGVRSQVLVDLGLDDVDWTVSVLACDDARIAVLNAEFRGKPAPTNVLSWPEHDLAPLIHGEIPPKPVSDGYDPGLGDIAISFDTCAAEASDQDKDFTHHVTHLLLHGLLHLLGYDHETDADAARMEALETKHLETMGIPDPY